MSLVASTATELLRDLRAGTITAVELTRACLAQIQRLDSAIGAFLRVSGAAALDQAAHIDRG